MDSMEVHEGIRGLQKVPKSKSPRNCLPLRGLDWRRGSELNRRIEVLQTSALPLGYPASGLVGR